MALKNIFFILLVTYTPLSAVYGQDQDDCVPSSIQQLFLSSNAPLHWFMHPNEPCEITLFQVDIVGDREDEYQGHRKLYGLVFFEICKEWTFTVTPVSNDVLGFVRTLTESIPLPADADLSLSHFNLIGRKGCSSRMGFGPLHLRRLHPVLQFSVTDEEQSITQDVYIQGTSLHLTFLSPCVSYQLTLRADNRAQPNIERSRIVDPDPIPVELKSLQANRMYFIKVYVENSGGVSPVFPLTAQQY